MDIFLTRIKISKVRHLENITIDLSEDRPKHLILTGKNGTGKTSLLEAIYERLNGISDPAVTFESSLGSEDELNKGGIISDFFTARRYTNMNIPQGPKKVDLKHHQEASLFLQYLVNLKAEKAFARDDGDMETAERIGKWFERFEGSLRDLFDDETLRLRFDRKAFNFYFQTKDREEFDFNTLADGYSAAIRILTDLIMAMEKIKPANGYDIPGIVFIDEIEAHLHVELQKQILPFLSDFFPALQFIVSSHSPFVITSLENAVVYDLEHRLRLEDLSPYSYDGIVERYFKADKYSELIKQKLKEYETLFNTDKKTEEEESRWLELRDYLKKVPLDFAPELVTYFQKLEIRGMT